MYMIMYLIGLAATGMGSVLIKKNYKPSNVSHSPKLSSNNDFTAPKSVQ